MGALADGIVTLADVAKSKDKAIGSVAEVLVRQNPMLNDIPYVVMNEGTIHKESIRSSLPSVYYRKANQAIPAGKSTIEERTFTGSHFESKSQMDKAVAERGGNLAFNRWNQAQGHLQAMGIEAADLTIYGSPETSNLKSAGLADIYSTLSASEEVSKQILDGLGAQSDNTSMWLVAWGLQSVFGIYPTNTVAGLKRTDHSAGGKLVQILGTDTNGNPGTYYGYEELFEQDHGLVVKDYRQACRACNIDISNLRAGTGADLIDLMIDMTYKLDSLENGSPVFYVNRTLEAHLDKQARLAVGAGGGITYMDYQGKRVLSFRGIPIRRSDSILNSEAQIT
jgi:hypothetical protein